MWQIVAGQQRVQKRDNLLRFLFAVTDGVSRWAKKRRYFNRLKTIRKISTQLSAQGLQRASKVRLIIAIEKTI
jgi:hypothetical protein